MPEQSKKSAGVGRTAKSNADIVKAALADKLAREKAVQSKNGRKVEKEEIITFAQFCLNRRFRKHEITAILQAAFNIAVDKAMRFVNDAKRGLAEYTDKTVTEHRNEAFGFYESIIRDSESTMREKIKAQEAIDKLLALARPILHKVEMVPQDNTDLSGLSDDELEKRLKIAEDQDHNGNGKQNGH